jgi:glycosyltransferase involved in cell wall biosynthesis
MTNDKSKISVLIPTKDRFQDIINCIESILIQTLLPDEIIIVDSSENAELQSTLELLCNKTSFRYVHANVGLTAARNIGVQESTRDIIFFFDDDVVLEKDFIKEIVDIFDNDPEKRIAGVCGNIVNPEKHNEFEWSLRSVLTRAIQTLSEAIAIVFLLRKRGDGTFRASGYPNYPYVSNGVKEVEFLPGGLTGWRREVLNEFKFDERLPGPSICEDDDFSYRVSRKYVNIFTPYAKLVHKVSPIARDKHSEIAKMTVVARYYLSKKNLPQTLKHKLAFCWSMIGLCLQETLHAATGLNIEVLKGLIAGLASILLQDNKSGVPKIT